MQTLFISRLTNRRCFSLLLLFKKLYLSLIIYHYSYSQLHVFIYFIFIISQSIKSCQNFQITHALSF
jgi:hypothetical protein